MQTFTPPFTVTAECMATVINAHALCLSIADGTGSSGIGVVGGQGITDLDTGFVYSSPQGGSWDIQGRLSPIPPETEVWYTLAIRVDAAGNATVAASSGGHILGQSSQQVGTGPFYVVLGQSSTAQPKPGLNQAYWLAMQVIHG